MTTFTDLEMKVLAALYESSEGNGHDFGFTDDGRPVVGNPRALSGVVASLVKKGVITVYDPVTTDGGTFTQFTFKDVAAMTRLLGKEEN